MNTQVMNDGSCIRIITDDTQFIINKAQIKTIDAIRNESVRIDIGEGPLRHVFLPFADVTAPAGLADANALRDAIKAMLDGSGTGSADFTPVVNAIQTEAGKMDDVKSAVQSLVQQLSGSGATQVSFLASIQAASDSMATTLTNANLGARLQSIHDQIATIGTSQATLLGNIVQGITDLHAAQVANNALMYPTRIDDLQGNIIYNGYTAATGLANPATTDAIWAIQRVTATRGLYVYEWANGNQQYTNVWDNRESLTYSALGASPSRA